MYGRSYSSYGGRYSYGNSRPAARNGGAPWTQHQEAQLRVLTREGVTAAEIARRFQRTENAISSRLKLLQEGGGIDGSAEMATLMQTVAAMKKGGSASPPSTQQPDMHANTMENRNQRWNSTDDAELVRLFSAGRDFDQIAQHLSRTKWGVEKRLELLGHYEPQDVYIARIFGVGAEGQCQYSGSNAPHKMQRWLPSDDSMLSSMFKKKQSLAEITNALGRSPYSVCCRLESLGLIESRADYARRVLLKAPMDKTSGLKRSREDEVSREASFEEGEQCDICMDGEKKVAFVPCGHRVCRKCAPKVTTCHICRKSVASTLNLF